MPTHPTLRIDPTHLPTAIELFDQAVRRLQPLVAGANRALTVMPPAQDGASRVVAELLTARGLDGPGSAEAAVRGAHDELGRIRDNLAETARLYGYVEDANTGKFRLP